MTKHLCQRNVLIQDLLLLLGEGVRNPTSTAGRVIIAGERSPFVYTTKQ